MTDDKPAPESQKVDGKEVWVTKDDSGVTAVSEDKEGADPRVATDAGDQSDSDGSDSDGSDSDDESRDESKAEDTDGDKAAES
jgi:hypothetical protein